MFIGLDLRLVKNKNAFLAYLKLRSFVPAHIRACRKQHVDLLRVVLSFMSLIHDNHRLPPLRIVLAHRLPCALAPRVPGTGSGRMVTAATLPDTTRSAALRRFCNWRFFLCSVGSPPGLIRAKCSLVTRSCVTA